MKDCNAIRPLLSEYVDGVLDDDKAWEIKLHLSACSVCSRVADDFSATARLLSSLPQAQPSANFEAMLAKRLADQVLKPKPASPLQFWKERVLEWWQQPGVRPAFASGAALAALIPVAFFVARPLSPTTIAVHPTPGIGKTISGESDTLNELWQEHDAYSSTVTLGDRASVLANASEGMPTL